MSFTQVSTTQLSTAMDRASIPRALKVLRDEANLAVSTGAPMQNRLRMLGAPGKILQGDYFTIGTTLFEFRDDTPPSGGTAGRIWIYNGANSADSRANAIKAINGVVEAAKVTYNGVTGPSVKAVAGVALGDVLVYSADAPGGTIAASATALATTDNLTTATDIWDAATMYGGYAQDTRRTAIVKVTLTAAMITKGSLEVNFEFTPVAARSLVENDLRKQNEAVAVVGNALSVTLAGGASPNNQAGDTLTFFASE